MESVYSVRKVKDLPKLHRAVWKGNLEKVRRLTKSVKTSELNSTDKEKRQIVQVLAASQQRSVEVLYALYVYYRYADMRYTMYRYADMQCIDMQCIYRYADVYKA